jgi:hypothetical protein
MNTVEWRNATPEQRNFWAYLSAKFNILTVTPLCYQGSIAGSGGLIVYDAHILYFALSAVWSGTSYGSLTYGTVYNEANAVSLYFQNGGGYWDATLAGAKEYANDIKHENFYFSRVSAFIYDSFQFNGYKLTI